MSQETPMTMEQYIRAIAGSFVLISLALGWWVTPYAYLFTAFVGANLLQSAFTRWCLMEDILAGLGVVQKTAEKTAEKTVQEPEPAQSQAG